MALSLLSADPSFADSDENEPDIIRIASLFRTLTLDPTRTVYTGSIEAFGQMYSSLFRRDRDGALQPALAESWEISEDGLEYIFQMREARFSDGSPITAEDAAFTLLRMRDDPEAAYKAPVMEIVDAWAEDARTLRVRFNKPNAAFLESVEMCFLGIVSKRDVEARGNDGAFADIPVTSGPYRVVEWRRNDRLILEANPYYWREGYPLNDGAELIEVVDVNTRVAMLRAGEIDAVRVLNLASADALESESGFEVPEEPAMRVHIALLNHARPPFNDLRVRQAAALAIDMERMSHAMTRGRGEPANALIPQQLTSYEADAPGWDYDPERARRLIEEAGATGSEVIINMTAPDAAWEMSALILQSYWRKVGLNVKIQKMDQALQQQRQDDGDYDAAIEWWYNETTDPDLGMKWAFCGSCGNRAFYTNYQNDRVDELTALGVSEMDPEKRLEIYKELHRIAFEEVAQIPLYFSPWLNGYSTNIEGLRLAPNTQWTLEETRRVR